MALFFRVRYKNKRRKSEKLNCNLSATLTGNTMTLAESEIGTNPPSTCPGFGFFRCHLDADMENNRRLILLRLPPTRASLLPLPSPNDEHLRSFSTISIPRKAALRSDGERLLM